MITIKEKKVLECMEICNRILTNLIQGIDVDENGIDRLEKLTLKKSLQIPTISPSHSNEKIQKIASLYLKELCVPSNVIGYSYLKYAIIFGCTNGPIKNITKTLYPEIAKEFSTTPTRIERAIRHAINLSWREKAGSEKKASIWGEDYLQNKPSNSKFISSIIEDINLYYY